MFETALRLLSPYRRRSEEKMASVQEKTASVEEKMASVEEKITTSTPTHIIDLLRNAAEGSSSNGFLYLERGLSEDATRESYAELYQKAQVRC